MQFGMNTRHEMFGKVIRGQCVVLLPGNIDLTLVNSLHGLLNIEKGGLNGRVIAT